MKTPASPIAAFQLERYFARWEFAAPYLLCTSDVQGYPMRDLLALADDEARTLWDSLTLGYTEASGLPQLRSEIARLYQTASPEDVLCFAGAEEAIYITLRVLLRPGDHMIVTFPGYQSSYQVAEAAGADVSRWTLRQARDPKGQVRWYADPDELRSMVKKNTRLILVNFPHNPTGALPTHAEWAEITRIAADAGCYLFSDEVYRLMEYDPADRLTSGVDVSDKGISLGVMSKPFGLAGLRVGWLACRDRALLSELASYKDYTTICNSAPSEILALIGLRAKEETLARSMRVIQSNLPLVERLMEDNPDRFSWIRPKAGTIAFPRWLGDQPIEVFTDALVQSEGVLLLPGTVYDFPGNHFRIGLGRENSPEAIIRLGHFIKNH